jgi:hypothetical protein
LRGPSAPSCPDRLLATSNPQSASSSLSLYCLPCDPPLFFWSHFSSQKHTGTVHFRSGSLAPINISVPFKTTTRLESPIVRPQIHLCQTNIDSLSLTLSMGLISVCAIHPAVPRLATAILSQIL